MKSRKREGRGGEGKKKKKHERKKGGWGDKRRAIFKLAILSSRGIRWLVGIGVARVVHGAGKSSGGCAWLTRRDARDHREGSVKTRESFRRDKLA